MINVCFKTMFTFTNSCQHRFSICAILLLAISGQVNALNITLALMSMSYIRPSDDFLYYGTMAAACPLAVEDLYLYADVPDNSTISCILQPSECDKKVNDGI